MGLSRLFYWGYGTMLDAMTRHSALIQLLLDNNGREQFWRLGLWDDVGSVVFKIVNMRLAILTLSLSHVLVDIYNDRMKQEEISMDIRKEVRLYQKDIKENLLNYFAEVEIEWRSWEKGKLYSPRCDIAIGPFAQKGRLCSRYDDMLDEHRELVSEILRLYDENISINGGNVLRAGHDDLYSINRNSRCFMVIEIENKTDAKQVLGSMINAAALGRIGLIIVWERKRLLEFLNIVEYLQFLSRAEKNTFNTQNLIILDKNQFNELLYKS